MGRINRAVYKMAPGEAPPRRGRGDKTSKAAPLTDREAEIHELLTGGWTGGEVARALRLSPLTVETHRARIAKKLKVQS